MSESRCWSILLLLCAIIAFANAIVCPVSTCSFDDPNLPVLWLNTSSMASRLVGTSFTLFPMKRNGEAFLGAYAQLNLTNLQELQPKDLDRDCHTIWTSPEDATVKSIVHRDMDWAQLCCEVSTSWDMIEPTINRTTASIVATDPTHPDFRFKLSFSLVNESVTYPIPGSAGTGGQPYNVHYSDRATKMTMEMLNWPWVGPSLATNESSPTFLKFYFTGFGQMEEIGNLTLVSTPTYATYNATTSRSYVELNFLKVYTADGLDYAPSNWGDSNEYVFLPETIDFIGAPFALSTCKNKQTLDPQFAYFTNLTYDPTLSALYDDPTSLDQTPEEAKQNAKKRLHAAAYAVPIALVVVGLAVAFVLLFVTPVKDRVFGSRTSPAKKVTGFNTDDADHTRHTAAPAAAAAAPAASAETQRGSWVRSTKIEH